MGDLAGQFADQRVMVPVHCADEPLNDLAVEVVAIGDRLGILALDVGEQSSEIGEGVAPALRTGERGDERLREHLQPAHRPAEEGGRDLTAGEQLLLATLEARFHVGGSFHRIKSSGRHEYQKTYGRSSGARQ